MPTESISEQGLLRRLHAGETAAAEELMNRYRPRLLAFARRRLGRRLGPRESVDDVVQGVLQELLCEPPRPDPTMSSPVGPWLFRRTLRRILDRLRFHHRRRRDIRREDDVSTSAMLALYRSTVTPSAQAVASEEIERLRRALARLPDAPRRLIEDIHLKGRPRAEIAAERSMSRAALNTALARALAKLAVALRRE